MDNRLVSVSGDKQAQYLYDYSGARVKKVENGITTWNIGGYYEEEKVLLPAGGQYIKTENRATAASVQSGKGEEIIIIGDDKPVIKDTNTAIWYYFANGIRVAQNSEGTKIWYHTDHLRSSSRITDMNGSEARYYNPVLCRFIQPDSVWDTGPQGLNRYSYCLNNPFKYTDPSGHMYINEGGSGTGAVNGNSGNACQATASSGITASITIENTVTSGINPFTNISTTGSDLISEWNNFSALAGIPALFLDIQNPYKSFKLFSHIHQSTGYVKPDWRGYLGILKNNKGTERISQSAYKYYKGQQTVGNALTLMDFAMNVADLTRNCLDYYSMLQSGHIDRQQYGIMVFMDGVYSAADAGLTVASSNPVIGAIWTGAKAGELGASIYGTVYDLNIPGMKELVVKTAAVSQKLGNLGTLRAVGDEMAGSNLGDPLNGTRQFSGRGMQGWATAGSGLLSADDNWFARASRDIRFRQPVLSRILCTWVLTVAREICSPAAISLLDRPASTPEATSFARSERWYCTHI